MGLKCFVVLLISSCFQWMYDYVFVLMKINLREPDARSAVILLLFTEQAGCLVLVKSMLARTNSWRSNSLPSHSVPFHVVFWVDLHEYCPTDEWHVMKHSERMWQESGCQPTQATIKNVTVSFLVCRFPCSRSVAGGKEFGAEDKVSLSCQASNLSHRSECLILWYTWLRDILALKEITF